MSSGNALAGAKCQMPSAKCCFTNFASSPRFRHLNYTPACRMRGVDQRMNSIVQPCAKKRCQEDCR